MSIKDKTNFCPNVMVGDINRRLHLSFLKEMFPWKNFSLELPEATKTILENEHKKLNENKEFPQHCNIDADAFKWEPGMFYEEKEEKAMRYFVASMIYRAYQRKCDSIKDISFFPSQYGIVTINHRTYIKNAYVSPSMFSGFTEEKIKAEMLRDGFEAYQDIHYTPDRNTPSQRWMKNVFVPFIKREHYGNRLKSACVDHYRVTYDHQSGKLHFSKEVI